MAVTSKLTLSERALIHAENMGSEGWYTTANVLAECAEALEGAGAEAWHRCVETIMTMAGLSCSLSPAESMVEFQNWLGRRPGADQNIFASLLALKNTLGVTELGRDFIAQHPEIFEVGRDPR